MTFTLPPLSARLAAVLGLVPEGSVAADVGAGHALLTLHLVASGRARRVIAVERSASELASALRFPEADERARRTEFRLGDGLTALAPEDRVGVVVVAGLGGLSILRILERHPALSAPCRLVLQPQMDVGGLRRGLTEGGFGLVQERLVEDRGRTFVVLAAEHGVSGPEAPPPGLTEDDVFEAGPLLLRDRPRELPVVWRRHVARLTAIGRRAETSRARAERILAYLDAAGATSGPGE